MREWTVDLSIRRHNGREAYRRVSVFCASASEALNYARRIVEMPGLLSGIGHKPLGPLDWSNAEIVTNVESFMATIRVTIRETAAPEA